MVIHKTCPICKVPRPLNDFSHYFSKQRNKIRPQNYCKLCEPKEKTRRSKEYYERNKEKVKQYARSYRANPKYTNRRKKQEQYFKKKYREELQDCYVADQLSQKLKLTVKEVRDTPGLIEAYRTKILLIRKIKKLKKQ